MLEYNRDRNNSMATFILHGCHCIVHQRHATLPGVRTERQDSENTSTKRTGQGPSLKSRSITLTGARYCQFSLVGHSWQHRLVLTSGFLHGSTLDSLMSSATRPGGWRNHRRDVLLDCQRVVTSAAEIFPPAIITLKHFTSACRCIMLCSHCPLQGPHLNISPLDCKVKRLKSNLDHLHQLSDTHSSYDQRRKTVTPQSNKLVVIIDKEGLWRMVSYTWSMDIVNLGQTHMPSVPLHPNPNQKMKDKWKASKQPSVKYSVSPTLLPHTNFLFWWKIEEIILCLFFFTMQRNKFRLTKWYWETPFTFVKSF